MRGNIICPLRTLDGIESFARAMNYLPSDEPCIRLALDLRGVIDDNVPLIPDDEDIIGRVERNTLQDIDLNVPIRPHEDSQVMQDSFVDPSSCMVNNKVNQGVQVDLSSSNSKDGKKEDGERECTQRELNFSERPSHTADQPRELHENERVADINTSKSAPSQLRSDEKESAGREYAERQIKVNGRSRNASEQPCELHEGESVLFSTKNENVQAPMVKPDCIQVKSEGRKEEYGSNQGTLASKKLEAEQPLSEHTDKETSESNHASILDKKLSFPMNTDDTVAVTHVQKSDRISIGDGMSFRVLVNDREYTAIIQEDANVEGENSPPSRVSGQEEEREVTKKQELSITSLGSFEEYDNLVTETMPPMTTKSVEEVATIVEDDDIGDQVSSPMALTNQDEKECIEEGDNEHDMNIAVQGTMEVRETKPKFKENKDDGDKITHSPTFHQECDSTKSEVKLSNPMNGNEPASDIHRNAGDESVLGIQVNDKEEISSSCGQDNDNFDNEVTVIPQGLVGNEEVCDEPQTTLPFHKDQSSIYEDNQSSPIHSSNEVGRSADSFEYNIKQNEVTLDTKTIGGGSTVKINLIPRTNGVNNDDIIHEEKKAAEGDNLREKMLPVVPVIDLEEVMEENILGGEESSPLTNFIGEDSRGEGSEHIQTNHFHNELSTIQEQNEIIQELPSEPKNYSFVEPDHDLANTESLTPVSPENDEDEINPHSPRYRDELALSPSSYNDRRGSFCLSTDRIMGELEEETGEELEEADDTWRTAGIWANNDRDEETNEQTARDEIALKILEIAEQMDV